MTMTPKTRKEIEFALSLNVGGPWRGWMIEALSALDAECERARRAEDALQVERVKVAKLNAALGGEE